MDDPTAVHGAAAGADTALTDEEDDEPFMSCITCAISEPVTEGYDFGNWIARHPLHHCTMGTTPRGQASLF